MKILIVDDDPFLLKILNLQLRNFGLRNQGFSEVVACERGADAIAMLENGLQPGVGLVFCDLHMPEMDGLEFIRHLGRVGYRGGLVLVTGKGERVLEAAEQLSKAHGLKLLGTIDKPVTPDRLREVVGTLLLGKQAAAAGGALELTDADLRESLDNGKLSNHYQPIVCLKTGEVVRFEALLRWQHPDEGLLLPALILDSIIDRALRRRLTDHVLQGAIQQAAEWREAGRPARIAANIAIGIDDLDLDFPDRLLQAAHTAGLKESAIALELTFAGSIERLSTPLEVLARLRLKHFRLCLDRFGTASSTFELLRDIPVDEIKLDSSFVRGARHRRTLSAVLAVSLDLARRLDLLATAVGIEDRGDWDFIRALGYDYGQGFFIAAPMAGAEVPDWWSDWDVRRAELVG